MALQAQLTCPMVGGGAGLNPDKASVQLLKETQHLAPSQLPSEHHAAVRGHPMDLEYVLRQIETDDCNLLHVLLP